MIKETRESRVARRDAFTAERDDHEAGNNSDGGINATAWGVRHEASDLGGICVLSGNGTGHGRGGPSRPRRNEGPGPQRDEPQPSSMQPAERRVGKEGAGTWTLRGA